MKRWIYIIAVIMVLAFASSASAASLSVGINQSKVIEMSGLTRVAIANPEIADVMVVSSYEFLLVGKSTGKTTLQVWADNGLSTYDVEVSSNDAGVAAELQSLVGSDGIRVSKIGKTIVLEGRVNSQYQKQRAEKVAGAYGDKVVNLLEIIHPVQVKLETMILEIDRSKINNLGITWGNLSGGVVTPGSFQAGQSQTNSYASRRVFGNFGTYQNINAQVSALVQNGNAKILSRPNVITLSGDKANIMVGGQIPIPVSNQNGQISVEWKDYGIKLDIEPQVNADGLIQSRIKSEVSSMEWNSTHRIKIGTDLDIPPLKMNKAETVLALSSGQTMALGGLINREVTKDVTKLPFLGDLPIIGSLFRSTSFNSGETELVILVTPTLVNPEEYQPTTTQEMKELLKEDPWGGNKNDGKDKGAAG
ncbi:type II and III secretion system protein family protein [Anaeroarcus burkinensis]|uniref:type II and III secretion system protein family protein n=1 Tax=Anaeroarcus burkinensis TaxID=82376 RepID=UPI00041ACEBA|nr:pilus assembly protein N-terminal domain-containing protein [Anaeroarcus burkinensis]